MRRLLPRRGRRQEADAAAAALSASEEEVTRLTAQLAQAENQLSTAADLQAQLEERAPP